MERDNKHTADSKRNKVNKKRKATSSQKSLIALLSGLTFGILMTWIVFICSGNAIFATDEEYNRIAKTMIISDYIDENYCFDIDNDEITDTMLKSLVEALDDKYSMYMTSEEFEVWEQSVSGDYCGIGVTITLNDKDEVEIINVAEDSPASEGGLKEGDIILKVNGKKYEDLDTIAAAMRGKEKTEVSILYSRDGSENEIKLKRRTIEIKSVNSEVLEDDIGYIRISQFAENTGDEFKKAVSELEDKNIEKAVIDLRSNGGGLVSQGIAVCDELLGECKVVCYVDSKGNKTYSYSDSKKTDMEYVLLVDENTASTSEIVTAAVKDNEGGKIIGTKTFGKGIIQNTIKFSDGSALKLTIMKYLSPKGNEINKKGISPDIKVNYDENSGKDNQLEKAVEVLKD